MEMLNKEAYKVEPDSLIYDRYRLIDSRNVLVKVPEGKAGILKRGQIIDFNENGETYEPHKEAGVANCIVARDTSYAEDETEATVHVYISGDFRQSACVTDVELTCVDLEHLRGSGIVLK